MAKEWRDDIAKENYKLFKENANMRSGWEIDAVRFDDFRYGSHFSSAEEKEMLAFRQAPLPISITTAICDTAEALMTSSKPIIKVAPIIHPFDENRTMQSKKVAQIYNHLVQKSWYDSLGDLQYDRVVRDYTNVGHGLFYVVPRNEFGEFTVDIKHIGWKYFYPHAETKDPFYRDMDNAVIAMRLSRKAAYRFVRSTGTEITEKQFEEDWVEGDIAVTTGRAGKNVRYSPHSRPGEGVLFIQRLTLEEQTAYIVIPKNSELNYGSSDIKYKTYSEKTPELIQMESEGKVTIRTERRFFLTEYTSVGNKGYRIIYPIDRYNIIPMVYDHRDNPYPLGRIWYLYPLQRALNKFIMVAILNGSLMNNQRILAEKNSIFNRDEWYRNFNRPGAILEFVNQIPGQSKPPIVMEAQPLGEAWLSMPKYLTYIMEYISGIFGAMMGDSRESPDVFSTVASLQSAGGQKIKRRLAQADAALSQVGKVVGEFYKHYAPPNSFSAIIDENGEQQEPLVYNRLEPDPENGNKVRIAPDSDLSIGFRDVRFTSQASNGYEAGTEAALLTNLATQLKTPQLIPLILKRLNIGDVDKIVSNLETVNQQANQIDEMAKVIKQLDSRTKQLATQLTEKTFELSKAQFDGKFKQLMAEIKNDPAKLQSLIGGNGNG